MTKNNPQRQFPAKQILILAIIGFIIWLAYSYITEMKEIKSFSQNIKALMNQLINDYGQDKIKVDKYCKNLEEKSGNGPMSCRIDIAAEISADDFNKSMGNLETYEIVPTINNNETVFRDKASGVLCSYSSEGLNTRFICSYTSSDGLDSYLKRSFLEKQ